MKPRQIINMGTWLLIIWMCLDTSNSLQEPGDGTEERERVIPGLHSGLLFQPRGPLLLATGVWTAVVRFHHKDVHDQATYLRKQFQDITKTLTDLLDQAANFPNPHGTREEEIRKTEFLKGVMETWKHEKIWMEAEVEAAEQEILELRSELRLSRRERALIPFLGDGLKWLFGTSTEKDTQRIHQEVKKVEAKVGQLHHIVGLQTTLIGTLSKDQKTNRQNIARLAEKTATLEVTLVAAREARHNIRNEIDLTQLVSSAIRTAGAAVMAFRHEVQKIVLAMAHTQQGKVTPTILHPKSLRAILIDIKQHLPTGWTTAVTLTDTPAEIYNVLDIAAIASSDGWEVHVQIPLKSQNYGDFFMYHVTSIPTHFMNSTIALQTDVGAEFFAISNDQRLHIEITQEDVEQCKTTTKKTICQRFAPLIRETRKGCLYHAFRDDRAAADQDCTRRIVRTKPQVYSLSDHQWLYALPQEELFAMQCAKDNEPSKGFRLQGTGVFSLPPGCAAIGDQYIIPAHLRGEAQARDFDLDDLTHFKLNLNVSAIFKRLPATKDLDQTVLEQIIDTMPASDEEAPKLSELKRKMAEWDQKPTSDVREVSVIGHTSISIGTLGVIGVVILAIFLCRRNVTPNSTHVIQSPPTVSAPINSESPNSAMILLQTRMSSLERAMAETKEEASKVATVQKQIRELQEKCEELL